ncbi:unnamed protein product [Rotaria magnacalcarata]|uniref:Uncharacterized protein n=1 Tax=Rotaria magnacalcarata TaxID=392030 RepID=A0A8S2L601_9BILA|nr:unnamed protein product [Rotaria magnacalcarata]
MDVLELPRPVINFLRTMAKESCRYALSWDIFGGPDSVTLTLTWKLIDDEVQSSIINETSSPSSLSSLKQRQQQQQQQQNDDNPNTRPRSAVKENTRSSSPRRSRRDENTFTNENISVPAIFRSSRGKSLEGGHIQPTKPMVSHQQHIKEHQTIINHQQQHLSKKEQQQPISTKSDQIYGNLYDSRSTSVGDGGTDPWVKRFECLFDDNDDDESTEHSEDKEALSATTNNVEECGNTSGKVKFKTKPDYF